MMPNKKCIIFLTTVLFHSTTAKKIGKISCQIVDTLKTIVLISVLKLSIFDDWKLKIDFIITIFSPSKEVLTGILKIVSVTYKIIVTLKLHFIFKMAK